MTDIVTICGIDYNINTTELELTCVDLTDSWSNLIQLTQLNSLTISLTTLNELPADILSLADGVITPIKIIFIRTDKYYFYR
jgi:hypothetical protein